MATSTNFKVSNGVTTSTVSNLIGLNITDDNTVSNTDISYASNNLNVKNKSASGSLILGTNNTPAITIDSSQNVTLAGNLIVNGTTTTVNSTTVTLDDPIITLGGDTAPASDDNKDRGVEFRWHNGTTAKVGFFGFDDSTGYLTFIPDATNTSEVFSGTMGDIQATNFRGALVGNASTATTLATSRNIAVTGDITGTASFNGSADASIATTLANSGATAGTYKSVTVNAKGLVTGGTNPNTLSGYGITDAAPLASPTFTGTVTTPTITTTGSTGLTLNNGTSNFIIFGPNGFAAPTLTTRSVGTKLVICNNLSGSNVDVALGVGANNGMWFSIPNTGTDFKWYGGTTVAATLDGTGQLTLNGSTGVLLNNATSNLLAFNSAGSGNPTFTTRSAGTKISFINQLSGTATEQAIGCSDSGNTLWFGVSNNTTQAFKWYGGTALAATLTGAGALSTTGSITGSGLISSAAIQANGVTYTGAANVASGTYYFGANGTRYLTCDGTNYSLGTGALTINGSMFSYGNSVCYNGSSNFAVNDGTANLSLQTTAGYTSNIAFHIPGQVATKFGLNLSNQFEWGGWSMAAGRMYLDASGNLTAAGNVTAYSDERLKTNIKTIDNALDKTLSLRGCEFDRVDTGNHEIGVIAQEIQKILPEVVLVGKDDQETLSVDYGKIVGLLIEAIKELNAKVDELSSNVTGTSTRNGA